MAKKNTAKVPLTPAVLHILLALSTGERHAYGIMKQVQADSQASNMVHVSESENPVNFVYYSVLLVGGVGAWLARLEARGLARTLFAMAATLALIAVMVPSGAPPYYARNAIGHGAFVALFTASGLMFRHASFAG